MESGTHSTLRFIAPIVPDLRAAKAYDRSLFDVELMGRKARLDDDLR